MVQDEKLAVMVDKLDFGQAGRSFSAQFEDFLDLSLLMFCNNPSERQLGLYSTVFNDEARREAFLKAFSFYGELAEGFHDPLGDMFMTRISGGHNGQFFTPEHICEMMARVAEPKEESINDPTCGSGRLVLAGLKVARESGHEPYCYANDLSWICARMTLLNLLVNSARGEVTCGDGLLLKTENFIFNKIDRVLMPNGLWLSTYWTYSVSNLDDVDIKRCSWIKSMLSQGVLVEFRHSNNVDEPVIEEKAADHITAEVKAVQLELEF